MSYNRIIDKTERTVPLPEQLNGYGYFANGAGSLIAMSASLQWLFTLKTYWMNGQKYPPVEILKKKGWKGLNQAVHFAYRGGATHAVGGFLIQGLAFFFQGKIADYLSDRGKRELMPAEKLFTSASAALLASPVNTVIELVYTQMYVTGKRPAYIVRNIYQQRGAIGLMAGWQATVLRAMVYISALFAINDFWRALISKCTPKSLPKRKWVVNTVGSAMAGANAGLFTFLQDAIKTRMQTDFKRTTYKNPWQTGRIIIHEQKLPGLWRLAKVRMGLISGVVVVVATAKDTLPNLFPNWMFKEEYRN